MSFLKPDPPQPPDPRLTAAAQTGTNVATSVANAYLGNVNQVTPQGSLNYNATGNYSWQDPSTGQTYQIPTFTATQTLSPTQQAIQGQQEGAQYNMAGMANAQSARISSLLSNEMDISGAPSAGDASNISNVPGAATSFASGGNIQNALSGIGDITQTYGSNDYSADRQRVEESLYGRLNPQLQRERSNIEQRLQDQGIRYGSQAYTSAMDDYNRQANDLRLGVTAAGGAEQTRLNQLEAQRAAFQNTAQQQGYEQALGAGGFANAAQGQQFQQNAAQAAFGNAGLAQQLAQQQSAFNASQAGRNQYLQEQYALRNQPINEITSLLSGSQVQAPNFLNTPSSQIPTTDVAGITQAGFQNQMGIYGQQNQNMQALMGGILGLGAGALRNPAIMSDERMKEKTEQIGTVFAYNEEAEREKLPIYEYQYKHDPAGQRHVGPMAQDVERIDKRAVTQDRRGVKYINPRRVMGNILRAA